MTKPVNKNVLAVVNDLFFIAKINDSAKRAGCTVEYSTDRAAVLDKAKAGHPLVVIFDLNLDSAEPLAIIEALKTTPETKSISLIGYLSHIQGDLKVQAQTAGCDMVMPKSAFSVNLPQILKRHAGAF